MAKTRKEGLYSPTKLKKALESVKNGRTIRQTAKDFEIPYSTIRSKMKGINPIEMKKGPSPVLSAEEETNLVNWILNLGVAEYPRTKDSILDSVQLICTKLKKVTPFTNNRPSKSWYNGFMKRHHDVLSTRIKNLTKRRVNINEKSIRLWFEEVGSYLKSKNLLNIDPSRVFNLDENCFYLELKSEEVIIKRSQKNVYNFCNDKDSLTALVTCNAKGEMPPGLIMFKGAKLPAKIAQLLPRSFVADKSENGWMTPASFYEYIVNIFYPWCLENNIVFPIILYVDGHSYSSHLTLTLSEFCAAKKIELISLYPNATHLMHPLDVALSEPLKKAIKAQ